MGRRALIRVMQHLAPIEAEAADNYACGIAQPHAQTQTNATAAGVTILAAALPIKYSGIFRIDLDAAYASGTTAKTVQHQLVVAQVANPATHFAGGAASSGALFGSDVGPDTTLAQRSQWLQGLNSDAAGLPASGVTFNGAAVNNATAGAQVFADTGVTPTLTGLLSGSAMRFSSHIVVAAGYAPKVRFTVGDFILIALTLLSTNGGDVVTYVNNCSLAVVELPLA